MWTTFLAKALGSHRAISDNLLATRLARDLLSLMLTTKSTSVTAGLGPSLEPLELLARKLKSPESAARWCRSAHSLLKSETFRTLVQATGSMDAAVTWLAAVAPTLPKQTRQIERLHVYVRDAVTGKNRRTSVSLDGELYGALVEKCKSGERAVTWLNDTTRQLTPAPGSSFSRAIQAEIIRFVAGRQVAGPIDPDRL